MWKQIEVNKNDIEVNLFPITSGKFAIQFQPSSVYFPLKLWKKIMRNFW